jgi:hypothetical protein
MSQIQNTTPSQTEMNLAAALKVIDRLVDANNQAQAYAMAAEEAPTPMQQWLAMWGIK